MSGIVSAEEAANFDIFRDCLSALLIQKFAIDPAGPKAKHRSGHGRKKSQVMSVDDNTSKDSEELSEFLDYITTEVFTSLPPDLRTLTYTTYTHTPALQTRYAPPLTSSFASLILQNLDPSVTETLTIYALQPNDAPEDLLAPVLTAYITHISTPPLPQSQTKDLAEGCEICSRDHLPLTYHHLIPKAVHEKALKRGWHSKEDLGNVAWLCRACHSFVHREWGHEVLARELFTVQRLLEKEEVAKWAEWVGRVRWKAR